MNLSQYSDQTLVGMAASFESNPNSLSDNPRCMDRQDGQSVVGSARTSMKRPLWGSGGKARIDLNINLALPPSRGGARMIAGSHRCVSMHMSLQRRSRCAG